MNEFEQDILKMLQHTAKKDGFSDDFLDNVLLLRKTNPDPHAELKAQYARDVEMCKDIDGLDAWQLWQWRYATISGDNFTNCTHNIKWNVALTYRRNQHAESIIAYHKCSERDKKRWQFKHDRMDGWCNCITPEWRESYEYRLKPETITIGGKEYAAPLRVAPELNSHYYFLDNGSVNSHKWINDSLDLIRLRNLRIFATKQDCRAVADAFNAILRGDSNDD